MRREGAGRLRGDEAPSMGALRHSLGTAPTAYVLFYSGSSETIATLELAPMRSAPASSIFMASW